MTFTFKAFTWNMQRGRSISAPSTGENTTDKASRIARLSALKTLCGTFDVGFITEPGLDLRDCVSSGKNPFTDVPGQWVMNKERDNQSDSNACRPMIYVRDQNSKLTANPFPLNTKSGADEASRNPAFATWTVNNYPILLVSFHATSGYNGKNNVQDFYDELDDEKSAKWQVVLVGGDLNSVDAKYGGSNMPKGVATHQSGSTLDGFYADRSVQFDLQIESTKAQVVETDFSLITTDMKGAPGCYFDSQRVSDHRPVSLSATVGPLQEKK